MTSNISNTSTSAPQPRVRLARARIDKNLSQQEVADLIGTTYVNISRWERGTTRPGPYFRRKLSMLFNQSEEELDLVGTSKSPNLSSDASTEAQSATDSSHSSNKTLYDPAIPLRPARDLVGRNTNLSQLKERLNRGGSVALTALNGLPGVGKTALAIALAHDEEIRTRFHDGILWAALGPHPNIPGLLSRWGTLLGISPAKMETLSRIEDWTMMLRTAISSRSLLLVIDDAWQVEDARIFRVGGSNCAHLLTTRFPFIAKEIADDGATTIEELGEEESMTLLQQLAPEAVKREKQRATDLIHAVGGLPLALTLMGRYLSKQTYRGPSRRITTILERLSHAEERLKISEVNDPVESHPSLPGESRLSLQSVFAVTDQQLDNQARAALYTLSVFPPKPNSFSEEAALAVADCTLDTLDALIDSGLLEINKADRYTLHQTIADYAHAHLSETDAQNRLITYAIHYVEAHRKDYELLEQENDIILAALETAHALGRRAELVQGATAFAPFLLLRALYSTAELHLQRAYEAAIALQDSSDITSTLLYMGEVALKRVNYTEAETILSKGLTIARQINNPELISTLLNDLGTVALKRGEYTQAEKHLQEGLTIARQTNNLERICSLLSDLGAVTWKRGEYTQAESYLQEGLTLARQIGNNERACSLLKALGLVAASMGNNVQEEAFLREALFLARQIGDREQVCVLLMNIGVTEGNQGKYVQAEAYFQEGLALARQIEHHKWISALLSNLGDVVSEQGKYVQAEAYFQEGLALARQIGHHEWVSLLLLNLGLTAQKQENNTQAETHFREGLALARQIGNPHIISSGLYEYGNFSLKQQKIDVAEALFQEMLTTIPEGGQELFALAQYGLARIAFAKSNFYEARRLGNRSVADLKAMGSHKAFEVEYWLAAMIDTVN